MTEQSKASQRAGIVRFTHIGDGDCDRCLNQILDGNHAAEVQVGSRTPWAAHTILCSECADRMEEKYGQEVAG